MTNNLEHFVELQTEKQLDPEDCISIGPQKLANKKRKERKESAKPLRQSKRTKVVAATANLPEQIVGPSMQQSNLPTGPTDGVPMASPTAPDSSIKQHAASAASHVLPDTSSAKALLEPIPDPPAPEANTNNSPPTLPSLPEAQSGPSPPIPPNNSNDIASGQQTQTEAALTTTTPPSTKPKEPKPLLLKYAVELQPILDQFSGASRKFREFESASAAIQALWIRRLQGLKDGTDNWVTYPNALKAGLTFKNSKNTSLQEWVESLESCGKKVWLDLYYC